MSESILKAIIKLFALIAKLETTENNSRQLVKTFLNEQLNEDAAQIYLQLFDQTVAADSDISNDLQKKKRTTLSGVKVLAICEQLNIELTQRQKVIVVLWLIEMIFVDKNVSEEERDFVDTVASTFNFQEEEYLRCFMLYNAKENDEITDHDYFLNISNKIPDNSHIKHIKIEPLNGLIRIMYLKSTNLFLMRYFGKTELMLNGHQVSNQKVYAINQGVSIRSSKFPPIFYSDIVSCFLTRNQNEKIVFQAKDISFQFKNGKIGLHPLAIKESSGKLIGIMGGSGAGKSTLLNILNGNDAPSKGEVLINGINFHSNKNILKGIVGHISQDDLLMESLSVFDNLYFNAKLCFSNFTDLEVRTKVSQLLTDIGLYEAKDLKVGNVLSKTISGGQRKRLNIALELIREPSILFVDEPTSGLSSRDSENIMDLLKELALKGKLVFVVIHQPSSDIFKMFDKLLVLDLGGYPIYYGNPVEAIVYFKNIVNYINANESECAQCGNVNPEQIFDIIESQVLDEYGNSTQKRKVSPKQWNKYFDIDYKGEIESIEERNIPKSSFQIPKRVNQFRVFLRRDILSKWSNTQYMLINILEAPVLAFILSFFIKYYQKTSPNGYVFSDNMNMPAYLFMSVIVALFLGMSVSAEEIIADRKIRKRESFLNLSKSSYLLSKIVLMFIFSAIQTFFFVLIGNSVLEIRDMYWQYWIVLFTVSCFANLLGLNISASFNSVVTIYILIPFLLIPQLLLSGVIVRFENLHPSISSKTHVPFVGKIMASSWAFEALMVNQFMNNAYEKFFYKVDQMNSEANFKVNYWTDAMSTMVDDCALASKEKDVQELESKLLTLRNEIAECQKVTGISFQFLNQLTLKNFTNRMEEEIRKYLQKVVDFYKAKSNMASNKRETITRQLAPNNASIHAFNNWKLSNENEAISVTVKNNLQEERIAEINNHLVQLNENIYHFPIEENLLKVHFYAPLKPFFGKLYCTFWVNVVIIWLMTLLLGITLYFNIFSKIVKSLGLMTGLLQSRKPKKYV